MTMIAARVKSKIYKRFGLMHDFDKKTGGKAENVKIFSEIDQDVQD